MVTRMAVVFLATLGTLTVTGVAAAPPQPRREFDFYKVGQLLKPTLGPQERARLGIQFIREEVANPTPTYMSLGEITHEYVLAQLIGATGRPGPGVSEPAVDTAILWAAGRQAQGELRDMLFLVLAHAGDRRAREPVIAFLRDWTRDIFLRESAARALAEFDDPNVIPILLDVVRHDPAYRERRVYRDRPPERHYLVRRGAWEALNRMRNKGTPLTPEALAEAAKPADFKR
jgi:HEAT repeat protein